jgi:hypothetical protein
LAKPLQQEIADVVVHRGYRSVSRVADRGARQRVAVSRLHATRSTEGKSIVRGRPLAAHESDV